MIKQSKLKIKFSNFLCNILHIILLQYTKNLTLIVLMLHLNRSSKSTKFLHTYKIMSTECSIFYISKTRIVTVTRHSKNPQPEDIKLINCTYLRRFEDVQDAISSGANINTFRDRQTPLIIATEMQNVQLVEYFLSVPDININFQNSFGQTSLLLAVNTLNHRVCNRPLKKKNVFFLPTHYK